MSWLSCQGPQNVDSSIETSFRQLDKVICYCRSELEFNVKCKTAFQYVCVNLMWSISCSKVHLQ